MNFKKYILSINDGQNNSSTLFDSNGKILFSLANENLSRKKLDSGKPSLSIKLLKERYNIHRTIYSSQNNPHRFVNMLLKNKKDSCFTFLEYMRVKYSEILFNNNKIREVNTLLNKIPISFKETLPHHECHLCNAYFTSGFNKAITLTADAVGDYHSSTTSLCQNNTYKIIKTSSPLNSPGLFYGGIAELLGFDPMKEVGKVTGLAAYGKPNKRLFKKLKRIFYLDNKQNTFLLSRTFFNNYPKLKSFLATFKKEDVAHTLQLLFEKIFCDYTSNLLDEYGSNNLSLSGGVFSNVKLNQRLSQLDKVKQVYIHPAMNDVGLSMGAGLCWLNKRIRIPHAPMDTIYLGPDFSDEQIKKTLDKKGIFYEKLTNIEYQVAELLSKGKIIARFNGALEYGPRALGNRSILCLPDDNTVRIWLNKKLKRTNFMPFAPTTIKKFADKYYYDLKKAKLTSKYMNISFDCKPKMKEECPGVTHIDGTARPQILSKEDNPPYYKILDEFRKITGKC